MRVRLLFLLLVALLVSSVTAAVAATPSGHDRDHHDKGKDKGPLVLYATETASTYITADGTVHTEAEAEAEMVPPTAGDRFVFVDTIYADTERTEEVGRNDIVCTVTEFSGTSEADFEQHMTCDGVVTLDDGTLAWQAAVHVAATDEFDPEAPFATVAITGGTGDYRGASGQASLFDESESEAESLTRYEIHLSRGRR